MNGGLAGTVGNLVPAGKARGDERPRLALANRRKQHAVSDGLTDIEMIVSKRARHAAATRIDLADRQAGNQSQSALRPRGPDEGFLLTMAVNKRRRFEAFEFEVRPSGGNLIRQPAVHQKRVLPHASRRL